jgi:hypothetical protein
MISFKLVYEKLCHLSVELEHKAYWAIKALNFDMRKADEKKVLELHELEEIKHVAYENANLYKEKTKKWHDKHISRRNFYVGEWVILFDSRQNLFSRKLRSRWTGPYQILEVFDHGAVEIWSEHAGAFKVNGQ